MCHDINESIRRLLLDGSVGHTILLAMVQQGALPLPFLRDRLRRGAQPNSARAQGRIDVICAENLPARRESSPRDPFPDSGKSGGRRSPFSHFPKPGRIDTLFDFRYTIFSKSKGWKVNLPYFRLSSNGVFPNLHAEAAAAIQLNVYRRETSG